MILTKAMKFAIAIFTVTGLGLWYIWSSQSVIFSWSDFFNGTIQTVTGGIVGTALTIVVYRYLYHRKSKS